jgi:hypothetical protein
MTGTQNPFTDSDRREIWTMLVDRDISAFMAADWSMVEGDFISDGFMGIDGRKTANPDAWRITFPTLEAYRDEWLRQAIEARDVAYAEDPRAAIFRATRLEQIDISGETALVHKKFDGQILRADGGRDVLLWQTLYFCRRVAGRWKIAGFAGYLPNPLGAA